MGINIDLAIVNVYVPHTLIEKRRILGNLAQIKSSRMAIRIHGGYFNVVHRKEERVNSRFCHVSVDDFNEFILYVLYMI